MNDVMKKRLVGVAILVAIGFLTPFLLSRCMQGSDSDSGRDSMRVYNVQPNGKAEPAGDSGGQSNRSQSASDGRRASAGEPRSNESEPPSPDAVSPQSPSEFSTPPVHGNAANTNESAANKAPTPAGGPDAQSRGAPANAGNPGNTPADADRGSNSGSDYGATSLGNGGSSANSGADQGSSSSAGPVNRNPKGWVVQVASFGKQDNARAFAAKLNGQFKASYTPGQVNGKTWYRVNVGPFSSEDKARSAARRLRQQGYKTLVRHLR